MSASHPLDIPLKPEFANAFWKILIKMKGERAALAELRRFFKTHPEMLLQTAEAMPPSDSSDANLEALATAEAFWEKLVKAVGEHQARQVMYFVMGEKKKGRPADRMIMLIYIYIRAWGLEESDEKIAKRLSKVSLTT
jgi:hypothetical protein